MRRSLLACALGLAAAAAAPGARAQGIDQTCVLPLTKFDPATVNVAYPDEAAVYYVGNYQAVPGTRLRITGQYPHARYASFNVYDNAQRPLDALADVQIGPDPGSTNPFLPGADRTLPKRDYTAFVDFGPLPAQRTPNTLYTGTGQNGAPNFQGTFIYRVYVPDKGLSESGGVPLPTVTLESTSSTERPPESACAGLAKPSGAGVNEQVAASNGLPVPAEGEFPGENPPVWHKFVNLPIAGADLLFENPYGDPFRQGLSQLSPVGQAGGQGGFLSNIHNAYLYTNINRAYGQVLATRLRAATFADTRPAPPRMPTAQLRYFSMCENEPFSQRFIACRTDDQTAVAADGFITYVVSTPEQRPANAVAACGATWIPWGPAQQGALIYRHMLPDPGFGQAIQRAERDKERATMRDYFPGSRYYADRAAYEKLGCAVVGGGGALVQPERRRCVSRRNFFIRLRPRGAALRLARVYVNGRRARVVRGKRLRSRVNLRGLPRGRFTVKIVAVTRGGKRLVSERRYRTCVARRR